MLKCFHCAFGAPEDRGYLLRRLARIEPEAPAAAQEALQVRIEPEVFAQKDGEMLCDLIRAAVNEAVRRVDEETSSQVQSIAGSLPGIAGLRIPGL